MSPNELLQINRTQPFQPYTICLSDGTSYAVRHPDNGSSACGRAT